MVIFTVEIEYSTAEFSFRGLELASHSLNKCIDHINNHERFPALGSYVIFTMWINGEKTEAKVKGYRSVDCACYDNSDRPITYEEVIKELERA